MICQLANDIIIQFYATDKSKPLLYFLTFPSIFPPLPPLKWLNIWVWVGKKRICYRIYKTYPLFSVRWNSIRFCMLSDRQETKYLRKEAVLWSVVQERETEISVSALPSTMLQVPFDSFTFVGRDADTPNFLEAMDLVTCLNRSCAYTP